MDVEPALALDAVVGRVGGRHDWRDEARERGARRLMGEALGRKDVISVQKLPRQRFGSRGRTKLPGSLPTHLPAHFVGCRGRAGAWFGQGGHTAAQLAARRVREGAGGTAGTIP